MFKLRSFASNAKNADNKQFFSKIFKILLVLVLYYNCSECFIRWSIKIFKSDNEILELTYQLVILIQSFMAFIIGVLASAEELMVSLC